MNRDALVMMKDVGLGLVQIGGLILTINLAIISSTIQQSTLQLIRGQIIWSAFLLSISILLGVIVLSLTIILINSNSPRRVLQKVTELCSNGQALSFFAGLVFMLLAVIQRLS
jgi:hypothetical protein